MRAKHLNWVVWIGKGEDPEVTYEERLVTIPDIEYDSDDHIAEAICKAAGDDADSVDDYYPPQFAVDPELAKTDPNPTSTLVPEVTASMMSMLDLIRREATTDALDLGTITPDEEGRWHIVVILEPDGTVSALSRRQPDAFGKPFAGPWGLLTEDEATVLARTFNDDPRDGGTAHVAAVYRFDRDPLWPEEYA